MHLFPITKTHAQKVEREAKRLRKLNPTLKHPQSLDQAAQQHGFLHWKHVTICRIEGEKALQKAPLTKRMQRILVQAAKRYRVPNETFNAFAGGLVVAVDIKDAEHLVSSPMCTEIADGWPIAAADLWPVMLFGRRSERPKEAEDQADLKVLDDFTCLRFFRVNMVCVESKSPESVKQRLGVANQWCWIRGKAVRAETSTWIGPERSRFERFRHLIDAPSLSFIEKEPPHLANDSAFQYEKQTPLGSLRYLPLSSGAAIGWKSARPVASSAHLCEGLGRLVSIGDA